MLTIRINMAFAAALTAALLAGPAAAESVPYDDLPPILKDLSCTIDPGQLECLEKCPPYCLNQPDENLRAFQASLMPAIRGAGITIRKAGDSAVIANRRGDSVSMTCEVSPLPQRLQGRSQASQWLTCDGAVGGQSFTWAASYPLDKAISREGALEFRRFLRAASPLFSDELAAIGGGNPTAAGAPAQDYMFCGIATGAATIGGGPLGGGVVAGLCGWFLSNGLD
jgi:hypothetical protein